eukprot:11196214-Lingulodinium_polyedra.AAC.1
MAYGPLWRGAQPGHVRADGPDNQATKGVTFHAARPSHRSMSPSDCARCNMMQGRQVATCTGQRASQQGAANNPW